MRQPGFSTILTCSLAFCHLNVLGSINKDCDVILLARHQTTKPGSACNVVGLIRDHIRIDGEDVVYKAWQGAAISPRYQDGCSRHLQTHNLTGWWRHYHQKKFETIFIFETPVFLDSYFNGDSFLKDKRVISTFLVFGIKTLSFPFNVRETVYEYFLMTLAIMIFYIKYQ